MSRRSLRPLAAVLGKLSLGAVVFVSTIGAWSVVGPRIAAHRPLPDAGVGGRCAIWFVGSSSIHRWTSMAADMAPWETHNRGVNGALVDEVAARFLNAPVDRAPAAVVFYLGENDIADGAPAREVGHALAALVDHAHRRMPAARVYVVGLKPSPARWAQRPEQIKVNTLMADWTRRSGKATFVDVGGSLLVDGRPGPFFEEDGIHLDTAGYRHWSRPLRAGIEAAMPMAERRACDATAAPSTDARRT